MVTRQQNLWLPIFRCVVRWLQENTVSNGSASPDRHFLLGVVFWVFRCRSQMYCGGLFRILWSWHRTRGHTVSVVEIVGDIRTSYEEVAVPYFLQCHFLSNWKHIISDSLVIIVTAVCTRTTRYSRIDSRLKGGRKREKFLTVQRADDCWNHLVFCLTGIENFLR